MPFDEQYRRQVALLLNVLPAVAGEECFALKGGTAINLFIRDLPRLSIDIDLTYLPIQPRQESLAAIDAAMKRIASAIGAAISRSRATASRHDGAVTKLVVRRDDAQIKIEVTPVLRGCVDAPALHTVSDRVQDEFGFAEARIVSFADLFAGKLVAALDRQHPRDLFDVRTLLAEEGIDDRLRRAFVVYLLSHHRPMGEVLACSRKSLEPSFNTDFAGLTDEPISLAELLDAREAMVREIVGNMPDGHRRFLLTFEEGAPDWDLLGMTGAADLPAVRWRQHNLDTLSKARRQRLVDHLARVLDA